MFRLQTAAPIIHGPNWNGETCCRDLAGSARSAPRSRPGKESQDRSRRSNSIAKIKMISARIIKIHGLLDQPKAEYLGVKIDIALGISRNRGNVMNSVKFHAEY